MKHLFFVLAVGLAVVPRPAAAQTLTQRLVWNQSEPVAVVQGFSTTVKIGAAAAAIVTPTCVVAGTGTSCSYPLPSVAPPGTVVALTETNAGGTVSASATVPNGPNSPASVSISITVTVP